MAQFHTSFVEDLLSFVRLKYCTVEEVEDVDFDMWRILVKE